MDIISKSQIREEPEVQSVIHFIEQPKLSKWGHIQRMETYRQLQQIYTERTQAEQKRERLRKTWN